MLAACTTEADGQITLSLPHIVRQQINQKVRDTIDELLGLMEGAEVRGHSRVPCRQRTALRDEVRIGKKSYVEAQIFVVRHAMSEAEAHTRNQQVPVRRLLLEAFRQMRPQLVHIELRGL